MPSDALLFSSKLDDPVAWAAALRAAMPELDVRVSPELGDPADIETALVWKAPPGELASLPNLKLITNLGAGVDPILADPTIPPHIPVARLGDEVMAQMMAQFVTLCVLRHHRDLARYERQQRNRRWHYVLPTASYDCRVGVMGIGLLGGAAARMLAGISFPVAGWGRSARTIDGVETYHGRDGLAPFLARTDILVCLLPLTSNTRHILNRDVFAKLNRTSPLGAPAVINAGRGGLQNEADIIACLDDGTLGAASLDVFSEEPLPPQSPFWTHPKVVLTPHNAADTDPDAISRYVARQIERFEAGGALENVVDPARGY